jgi:hypothetical protein
MTAAPSLLGVQIFHLPRRAQELPAWHEQRIVGHLVALWACCKGNCCISNLCWKWALRLAPSPYLVVGG